MITQRRLKELVRYAPDTGVFTWLVDVANNVKAGDVAGHTGTLRYRAITILGVRYKAHRLAFFYMTGSWPEDQIDHINHDRADNRWENLRVTSCRENQHNKSLPSNNSSGVIGVNFNKSAGKWYARINHEGKRVSLGYHHSFDDAVAARKAAEIQYNYHSNHGK